MGRSSSRPTRTCVAVPHAVQLRPQVVWHLAGAECCAFAAGQVLAVGIRSVQTVDTKCSTAVRTGLRGVCGVAVASSTRCLCRARAFRTSRQALACDSQGLGAATEGSRAIGVGGAVFWSPASAGGQCASTAGKFEHWAGTILRLLAWAAAVAPAAVAAAAAKPMN